MLNLARTDPRYNLQWDHRDMIRKIDLGGGGIAYYQYDSGKQRTRKRIENQNGLGGYWERIYLGGYERYRRFNAADLNTPAEEIETHHLFEGEQRVLMVDDVITTDKKHSDGTKYKTGPIYRYQYSNHLGSACLELDHEAKIISYEEYRPYGTSAYRAKQTGSEAPAKRYRYTGMERDEESGLSYHSTRYLVLPMCRWTSADPLLIKAGINVYIYAGCNPIGRLDRNGKQASTVRFSEAEAAEVRSESWTMVSAAAAIRETWKWDDQEFAQQARDFYYKRFQDDFRFKSDQQAKKSFFVWGLIGAVVAGAVTGGITAEAIITAAGGAAAPTSVVVAAHGVGGALGGSVEVASEQGLRYVSGEKTLSQSEMAIRVSAGAGIGALGAGVSIGLSRIAAEVRGILNLGDEVAEAAESGFLQGAKEWSNEVGNGNLQSWLSDSQLIARSEAYFQAVARQVLEATGRPINAATIGQMRRITASVLQGTTKDGQMVRLIAINDGNALIFLREVASQSGDIVVGPIANISFGPRLGIKLTWEHAEQSLYSAAREMGLMDSRVASSNLGCFKCQETAINEGFIHVNPKPWQ